MSRVDLSSDDARAFVTERHLATLTTVRPDGTPHVVPVGFTWDGEVARVITSAASVKVTNVRSTSRAVVCQVDGGRWLSIEGLATVSDDIADVSHAVELYTARYQAPRVNPARVVVLIRPEVVMGRV